mmetsp:Transcript_9468/g.15943  ORF Transcript_9468/g.15943 Transcript_9468/m.15943 type:complete len:258 (-) Transcript_9468:77-850(-)
MYTVLWPLLLLWSRKDIVARLAGGHGDVLRLGSKCAVDELGGHGHRPAGALEHDSESEGNVDDNLRVRGLLPLLGHLQVGAAGVADPSGDVEETEGGEEDLTGVAVLDGETGVGNQVGQPVGATQGTLARVVSKSLVGAIDGGLERQGGGGAGVVLLQALLQRLHLLLLLLGVGLGLGARGEPGDIGVSGGSGQGEAGSEGDGSSGGGQRSLLLLSGGHNAHSAHGLCGHARGGAEGGTHGALEGKIHGHGGQGSHI